MPSTDVDVIKAKLSSHDIGFVAKRDIPDGSGQSVAYFTAKTITNATFLIELKFKQGMNITKVTIKSSNKSYSELCKVTIAKLLLR